MSVSVQQKNQLVFLNSRYATSNNNGINNSDVTFLLPKPISKPKDTNLQIRVSQFIFPVSFYNVNSTNNTLVCYVGISIRPFMIPEGNYTTDTLQAVLDDHYSAYNTRVTYDETTMKFTFSNDAEEFYIDYRSTCLRLLGFTEVEDHPSQDDGGGVEVLTSEFPVDLSPTKCLHVAIPNLSINNVNGLVGQRTPVLVSAPVSKNGGDIVTFINDAGPSSYTQEDVINELNIKIFNDDISTLTNFQNQHWTMTLEFSFTPTLAPNQY